jgi:hypothetical protein
MVRTTLFIAFVALTSGACADDPVVAGGGLPTNIKPNNAPAPSNPTSAESEVATEASPDTGCLECTIFHVHTSGGDNLRFVDHSGDEVCSMWVGASGLIWNDTCAELQITAPVSLP